jgi:hypothetical protein
MGRTMGDGGEHRLSWSVQDQDQRCWQGCGKKDVYHKALSLESLVRQLSLDMTDTEATGERVGRYRERVFGQGRGRERAWNRRQLGSGFNNQGCFHKVYG